MKFNRTIVVVGSAIALSACAGESTNSDATGVEGMDVETATLIAALEINADGSDVEVADASGDDPLLMRSCNPGVVRRHLVRHFDRDGDGEWRGGERPPMGAPFGPPPWAGADAGPPHGDFDGEHPARAERVHQWRAQFDADGSGDLDETERAALHAELTARCEERNAALVAEFDADGSGDLDEAEWAAAHAAVGERFGAEKAKLVDRFDRDGDGELDASERRSARSDIARELSSRAKSGGFGRAGRGGPPGAGPGADGGARPEHVGGGRDVDAGPPALPEQADRGFGDAGALPRGR